MSVSPFSGEATADLVIIGGGYTGLSAAFRAASQGGKVHLLEAGVFGGGGSGRNVGLANAGLWLPPQDINAEIGPEAGKRLSAILADAPNLVFDLIQAHDIQCEPVRNGTLHCAHAPKGMNDLQKRFEQLKAIGAPVELLSRDQAVRRTGSEAVFGALFDPRAGTVQPLAYARGLARIASEAGAKLHAHSPATSVRRANKTWHIDTATGRLRAKKLLIATNGYALPIAGCSAPAMIPVNYFQTATDPLPDAILDQLLPGQEGCWDTALVMSSWRLDAAGRLIIGGMGALNHPGKGIHLSWLRRKLIKLYPALQDIPFRQTWFGRIAMTSEHLPKILELDDGYICFGYSGRGICPGTVFGQSLANALLTGVQDGLPVSPVSNHALPLAGTRGAYYELGATLTHLVSNR